MIAFRVSSTGSLELAFRSAQLRVGESLRVGVTRWTTELLRAVKAQKLSGQVLRNRTGTLRRSVNMRVTETNTAVVGQVGTAVRYAAAHEYGVDKLVEVKQHWRRQLQAFGRPIPARSTQVAAHPMRMRLPERSFLRSALRELAPQIEADLRQRVAVAARGDAPAGGAP